ncbi:MAG: hypothetical protein EBU49_11965, partial [Proteobacteria bacterium]|nr:hypothetical protein [Pseudomonadota bacterium]
MLDKSPQCNGLFDLKTSGGTVLVHGGAGGQDPRGSGHTAASKVIEGIADRAAKALTNGASGLEVVKQCLFELESEPCFNAGLGAALWGTATNFLGSPCHRRGDRTGNTGSGDASRLAAVPVPAPKNDATGNAGPSG